MAKKPKAVRPAKAKAQAPKPIPAQPAPDRRPIPPQYNPDNVAEALLAHDGSPRKAAEALGCTAALVRKYITLYPACATAAHEAREVLVDAAEESILDLINSRSSFEANARAKAAIYITETHGKSRGYGKAVPITGNLDLASWSDAELIRLSKGDPLEAILMDRTNATTPNPISHDRSAQDSGSGNA